jgi:hypothetical protein
MLICVFCVLKNFWDNFLFLLEISPLAQDSLNLRQGEQRKITSRLCIFINKNLK